jgi:hypothetical protein
VDPEGRRLLGSAMVRRYTCRVALLVMVLSTTAIGAEWILSQSSFTAYKILYNDTTCAFVARDRGCLAIGILRGFHCESAASGEPKAWLDAFLRVSLIDFGAIPSGGTYWVRGGFGVISLSEVDVSLTAIRIPHWFALGLIALATAWVAKRCYRCERQIYWARHGQCEGCGYDLTGNESSTCSECGTSIPGSVAQARSVRPTGVVDS